MIGVFDSGIGGLCSFERLNKIIKDEELVYLADRGNAPYGTRTRAEIISLAKRNIARLRTLGARKILIACCTASGIYGELDEDERAIAVPIITPAAEAALNKAGKGGKIAVISTMFTAKNHIFKNEILKKDETATVTEYGEQLLVELVELGASDSALLPREAEYLDKLCGKITLSGAAALILGCTHFSHLAEEIKKRLGSIAVIDTAALGADALYKSLSG